MFIDKAIFILGILLLVAWGVVNFIIALNYSLKEMVEYFWKNQKVMGKICINLSYLPAWVMLAVMSAVTILMTWILTPIYRVFHWLVVDFLHSLYKKAIKFEL